MANRSPTEHLANHTGPGVNGLLNATFGHAAELIIGFMALRAGETEIVKASLTGSIIGNMLMVLGLAMLFGGWKHKELRFNRMAAETRRHHHGVRERVPGRGGGRGGDGAGQGLHGGRGGGGGRQPGRALDRGAGGDEEQGGSRPGHRPGLVDADDGRTNWFEGVQLLAVYAILAVAFYFI